MMNKKRMDVGQQTRVILQAVSGDLVLQGWRRMEIQLEGSVDPFQTHIGSDQVAIESSGDLSLSLPHQLAVELKEIGGDALVSNLAAALSVEQVGGDLSLRDVSETRVERVGGDLFSKHIRGDISIRSLGGDCLIHDVDGQISGKGIGGDLLAEEIGGGIDISVGGDIRAHLSPVPWQVYALSAAGDIFIQVPEDSNAIFEITSDQEAISLQLGGKSQVIKENEYTYEMGEGGCHVTLSAGGEVLLGSDTGTWSPELYVDADMEGLAEQITKQTSAQIQDQLSSLEKHLNKHLAGIAKSLESLDLPDEKIKGIQTKIEEAGRRATLKAQRAMQKAEAKLEKRIAHAQKKAHRKRPAFDLNDFLDQKEQEHGLALEEERLMILRMLQEKKITAEQADQLLTALGGEE